MPNFLALTVRVQISGMSL